MSVRKATHAGSWYPNSAIDLTNQLETWLEKASFTHGPARALIVPHAGYKYCGSCGAHAYKQVKPENVKRIFILGPSHHFGLMGCALTTVAKYQTPLYDLNVDAQVNGELEKTRQFDKLDLAVDHKEHSIEMQLPYIAKIMEKNKDQFTIVPILVGTVTQEKQLRYAKILQNYLENPHNLFIISSDFCHWGNHFHFTYYDSSFTYIYQSIENLDRIGMDTIESLSPVEFSNYLRKYGNTICGRHAIGIFLYMVYQLTMDKKATVNLKFLKYEQSNQCKSISDSSVSYAAAALILT